MASNTIRAALVAAIAAASLPAGAMAQTQGKLSDKSVNTLMDYAWQIMPSKFTTPAGKLIEVDKTKKAENSIPVENGREVIRVAYSSAQAQVCELWEEQQDNFDTLMRREQERKKWTEQQLLYITTLHRMTIHAVAGKLRVEEKAGELRVFLEPILPGEGKCTEEQKGKIRETIIAYVKLDAPAEKGAEAQQPPAKATPAAAPPQKKK